MKSTKLQRDILRWEYENETRNMYSPPSPIEWLENKLIELRKRDVVGRSEQSPCDCNVKLAETTLQVYCPKCYKTHKMK